MNKITLLAGIAIGAVLTAGVAQLQAQAPPAAATRHVNAVFVITLQTITDQARYEKEFQQQATKTIKDAGGRFVVRNDQVTEPCWRSSAASRHHRLGVARRSQEVAGR